MALTTEHVLTDYSRIGTTGTTSPDSHNTGNRNIKGRILLNTRLTRFLICPLLPLSQPKHALAIPEEVWRRVFRYLYTESRRGLALTVVCQTFKVSTSNPHLVILVF